MNMKKTEYTVPECQVWYSENNLLATSGYDQYHEGGGGRYGEGDINDNPYVF